MTERTCGNCEWAIPYDDKSVHCGHASNGRRDCLQCRGKAEECRQPRRWWKPVKVVNPSEQATA